MITDRYGGVHTSPNEEAVGAFEAAVFAVAAHRPIGSSLSMALKADPDMVAAHALTGLGHVTLAQSEAMLVAHQVAREAERLLERADGGTASEKALVGALRLAVDGHMAAAADLLDRHLEARPCDFLHAKIAHALHFMAGQSAKMLASTSLIMPSWSEDQSAYGFLLGCHAFGLEECGHFGAAESVGRKAYRHEKADAWGLHAVSHVMEMSRRTKEGVSWLEAARSDWRQCNNFSFHLGWHLALFQLELGDADSVLELYDRDIRPAQTDDFRDMANAASILWRLELEGVQTGDRWQALHEIARKRRTDVTYVFGSLHYLLTLAALGETDASEAIVSELRALARNIQTDQGKVAADVGVPLAEVILALSSDSTASANLGAIAHKLPSIGGSHAQRDVFLRTLMMYAAETGDAQGLLTVARVRQNLRSTDRFVHVVEARYKQRKEFAVQRPTLPLASQGL